MSTQLTIGLAGLCAFVRPKPGGLSNPAYVLLLEGGHAGAGAAHGGPSVAPHRPLLLADLDQPGLDVSDMPPSLPVPLGRRPMGVWDLSGFELVVPADRRAARITEIAQAEPGPAEMGRLVRGGRVRAACLGDDPPVGISARLRLFGGQLQAVAGSRSFGTRLADLRWRFLPPVDGAAHEQRLAETLELVLTLQDCAAGASPWPLPLEFRSLRRADAAAQPPARHAVQLKGPGPYAFAVAAVPAPVEERPCSHPDYEGQVVASHFAAYYDLLDRRLDLRGACPPLPCVSEDEAARVAGLEGGTHGSFCPTAVFDQ